MAISVGSDVGLPKNNRPKHTYFKLYVGDNPAAAIAVEWDTGKPQIYQAVEVTKIGNAGTTVQMVLFDDNWTELETLFHNRSDISFEYGYVDGPRSERYRMVLASYTVDIKFTGILLHIEGISQSIYDNLQPMQTKPLGNNPSKAIRTLCTDVLKYQIAADDFLETEDIPSDQLGEEYNFALINDNAITYIEETILPLAKNNDDTLVFWVDDTTKPPTAHLSRKHPELSQRTGYRTYIYGKGYNSTVSSLSFQMKGVFSGSEGGGLYITTKESSESIDLSNKENPGLATFDVDTGVAAGKKAATLKASQSHALVDYANDSKEVAELKMQYSAICQLDEAAVATMTILGDPQLELLQYVNLMIIQDDGKLYHLSGIYQILGLIDTIENGKYLTTVKLIHAGWFADAQERSALRRAAREEGITIDVHEVGVTP